MTELDFVGGRRQVPADGEASATLRAELALPSGDSPAGRTIVVRPLDDSGATSSLLRDVGANGAVEFEVNATEPGAVTYGLFDGATFAAGAEPLATIDVEFTRKVVVLAPGFESSLAARFAIFGPGDACADPTDPQSLREALVCLGYRSDAATEPLPGATVVDMAWEAAPCRAAQAGDDDEPRDCVATISRAGGDVAWRPADYNLADLGLSMLRQQQIDLWGHRLAETMAAYDRELYATAGYHASFYLVGHSMGGQLVVRTLRAILDDAELADEFDGANRGRLAAVVAIDGALNWTGQLAELPADHPCQLPVRITANPDRERDNVAAVEDAFARFGTLTVAVTSFTDPIVGPDVALLREPDSPSAGYVEALFHEPGSGSTEQCTHSTLLRPEPAGYPLFEILREHVGPAAGD